MEKKKESVVVELRNYIRRIKSMAIEVRITKAEKEKSVKVVFDLHRYIAK